MSSSEEGAARGEDPEPGEGVLALVAGQRAVRHGRAARCRGSRRSRRRPRSAAPRRRRSARAGGRRRALDRGRLRLEAHVGPAGGDQVLDHLLLAVDRDRAAAREVGQRDPVALAAEAQLEAVVHHALAVQAVGHAELVPARRRCPARARRRARAWRRTRASAPPARRSRSPRAASRWASTSPAGPAPTIATCVSTQPSFRAIRRARAAGTPGISSASVIAISTTSGTVQSPDASCTAPSSHGPVAATR